MSDTITVPRELAERTKRDLQAAADHIAALEAKVRELEAEREGFDAEAINLIHERDFAEEIGTKLANSVGEYFRVDVGEHSSANDPRDMALAILDGEYVTDSDTDRKLTASRQQVERLVEALKDLRSVVRHLWNDDHPEIFALDAACEKADEALAAVKKERENVKVTGAPPTDANKGENV